MNAPYQRATIHFSQGRHDEALRELAQAAALEPDDFRIYCLRSLILGKKGKKKEALAEAQRGIAVAPDVGWPHYVMAIAQARAGKVKPSELSIRKAMDIDPENDDYHVLFGQLMAAQARWKVALQAADHALTLEPDNEEAQQLRARALSFLGKRADATAAAAHAISENPDSASAHAAAGWVSLRHGDRKKATENFKEALRLDPNDKYAREGLLEALRAGFPPYRIMLAMTFAIARLPRQHQTGVILLLMFGFRLTLGAMRQAPNLVPILAPFAVLLGLFYFMRWFGELLTDAILLFHPLGRLALGPSRRSEATVFACFLVAGPIFCLISLSPIKLWGAAFGCFLSLFILGLGHNVDSSEKAHKITFWICAAISALITGAFLVGGILLSVFAK